MSSPITSSCFKCPKDNGKTHQTEIKDIQHRLTKNNRKQAYGFCTECGGNVSKFVSMETKASEPEKEETAQETSS